MSEALKVSVPRFVGQAISRKEDGRFLTGRGRYIDDMVMPGMLHAAFLRSPFARAKIISIDAAAARAAPGVAAVYLGEDINEAFGPIYGIGGMSVFPKMSMLAQDAVRFVGDPIAIIVASDRYLAEDAAELIQVEYEPETPVLTLEDAKTGAPVHAASTSNLVHTMVSPPDPELDRIFAEAAHVVRKTVAHSRIAPTSMETRGIIVQESMPGQLNIWQSQQTPHMARNYAANVLRMPENQIRIVSNDVGGAFGGKSAVQRDEMAVIEAARRLRRPVKWIEDRVESLTAGGHSRLETTTMEIAFDAQAKILGMKLIWEGQTGAYPIVAADCVPTMVSLFFTGPYRVPRTGVSIHAYFTNTCGEIAFRGPWAAETLIRETAMDEAARQIGIDPVELRRRNVILAEELPYTLPAGMPVDGVSLMEGLDGVTEMFDIAAFRKEQAQARTEGRYLGLGLGLYLEPTAISGGLMSTDLAEIRMDANGKVSVSVTAHSQGQSVETTMAQIVADELGVDVDDVSILMGDTATIGVGSGAAGSRQGVVVGAASKMAAGKLRDKILQIGAHLLQSKPEDLRLEGGAVTSGGATPRSISLREVAEAAYINLHTLPLDMEPGLEAQHRYRPPFATYANGAHIGVVEVDINTGVTKILRWLVCEDCGVMLNPAVVEGQVAGGISNGIGTSMLENLHYDPDGNPTATTFKDYLLPLIGDVPVVEFKHLCTPSDSPTGAKGVGEGGAIITPPTLFNAVMDALAPFNPDIQALPLSPDRILAAIAGKTPNGTSNAV